jgi:hypothetical protein
MSTTSAVLLDTVSFNASWLSTYLHRLGDVFWRNVLDVTASSISNTSEFVRDKDDEHELANDGKPIVDSKSLDDDGSTVNSQQGGNRRQHQEGDANTGNLIRASLNSHCEKLLFDVNMQGGKPKEGLKERNEVGFYPQAKDAKKQGQTIYGM